MPSEPPLVLHFEPNTIQHLGVKLYSQLPLALAELVSNSYDAGAELVGIYLDEADGSPSKISVLDDGGGLTYTEINEYFLRIGRNRREESQPETANRPPVGKKGLGKLAAFGIANTVEITTVKDGLRNSFIMRYSDILDSTGEYTPILNSKNEKVDERDSFKIVMTELKRKSSFDVDGLANSLSRTFIFRDDFQVAIKPPKGDPIVLNNLRRYSELEGQFEWNVSDLDATKRFEQAKLIGKIVSSEKPIAPSTRMRGISLFSRGKLVNSPEFYRDSTSSHAYSYLAGHIDVSFIEEFDDDVISTNRQTLLWDNPILEPLKQALGNIIGEVANDWRAKRKHAKEEKVEVATGINTGEWIGSMPESVKGSMQTILDEIVKDEAAESTSPIIEALYNIVPRYPLLHWRHLHPEIRSHVEEYYVNGQYGHAADQGVKILFQIIRDLSGSDQDGENLADEVFPFNIGSAQKPDKLPMIQLNDLSNESEQSIQRGQQFLAKGITASFRNPISHQPIKDVVPELYSEVDCLNVLSLATYLLERMKSPTINKPAS